MTTAGHSPDKTSKSLGRSDTEGPENVYDTLTPPSDNRRGNGGARAKGHA